MGRVSPAEGLVGVAGWKGHARVQARLPVVTVIGDEELQRAPARQANPTATDGGLTTPSGGPAQTSRGFMEAGFDELLGRTGTATSITVNFEDQFGNLFDSVRRRHGLAPSLS